MDPRMREVLQEVEELHFCVRPFKVGELVADVVVVVGARRAGGELEKGECVHCLPQRSTRSVERRKFPFSFMQTPGLSHAVVGASSNSTLEKFSVTLE